MIQLSLAWILLTVLFWTSGSSQDQDKYFRYPKIKSNVTIDCDCGNHACDLVYWFRIQNARVQFLGRCNNADRVIYGKDMALNTTRFKFSKRGSKSFMLRIIHVKEEDAGIYSCLLKDNKDKEEMLKPVTVLLPGVTPPTPPPKIKPKPPQPKVCSCSAKNPEGGCGLMILWPLVGLAVGLALALICTLYYFSRLPKKCHHHFVKKRQLT